MSNVEFKDKAVWIRGEKVQIISGAIHYFRVPRELWRDRLEKLLQCGFNCVETYMCWNLHEPEEGTFDFSGMLDFEAYIQLAQELGLYVIVRPGPFICAEWDNGGLPYWLMVKDGIEFRRMNEPYLNAVRHYYHEIMPRLAKLQIDNGGPVIAMQVENEYGSYGNDKEYLKTLRQMSIDDGITVPLFVADGGADICIQGGLLDGSPLCLTFGSKAAAAFELGKKYRPDDPGFCMEFWDGWFDHWGCSAHHDRKAEEVADEVDDMLRAGGNVNLYMFHGGTNFAFNSGANGFPGGEYTPDTTSYDYDAPLSETGDIGEKYLQVQAVVKKYRPDAPFGIPEAPRKKAYGKIDFTECAELFDILPAIADRKQNISPICMEKLGQAYGFTHYRTHVPGPIRTPLYLWDVKDRAIVYLDGKQIFTYYRNDKVNCIPEIDVPAEGACLDILVENMGRINYGPLIGKDFKGICDGVSLGNQYLFNWDMYTLPMDQKQLAKIEFKPFTRMIQNKPAFYRTALEIQDPADTFIKFPGIKGVVWVNDHNLGRYWNIGPGSTLYVPAPFLKKGRNEIIVFETEKLLTPYVNFVDSHCLR